MPDYCADFTTSPSGKTDGAIRFLREDCRAALHLHLWERILNAPAVLTVGKFRRSVHLTSIWNERAREDSLPFTPEPFRVLSASAR
jgi:hypothetical protein